MLGTYLKISVQMLVAVSISPSIASAEENLESQL